MSDARGFPLVPGRTILNDGQSSATGRKLLGARPHGVSHLSSRTGEVDNTGSGSR
jgi:hypothetical protein